MIAPVSPLPSASLGFLIIGYLAFLTFFKPVKAFCFIFGIKLTFDAFWFIDLSPIGLEYGLLEIFFVTIVGISFFGPRISFREISWPLVGSVIYLGWVAFSPISNEQTFYIPIFVRQAGICIGLFLGIRYIKNKVQLDFLIYLLFLSTIFPVLASFLQIILSYLDITILYHKTDSVRGFRLSGFYYDPATSGMVNIISLLSNLHLIRNNLVPKKYLSYHFALIPCAYFITLAGTTRSVLFVATVIVLAYILGKSLKQNLQIIFLCAFLLLFAQPYMEKLQERNLKDLYQGKDISSLWDELPRILEDDQYRSMFTGRVSLWQNIWSMYKSASPSQKLWGTGYTYANAHSSYFFLLLGIGAGGLILYLLIHLRLLSELFSLRLSLSSKKLALLCIVSILLLGTSTTAVNYTSFQWIVYLLVGGASNLGRQETLP